MAGYGTQNGTEMTAALHHGGGLKGLPWEAGNLRVLPLSLLRKTVRLLKEHTRQQNWKSGLSDCDFLGTKRQFIPDILNK